MIGSQSRRSGRTTEQIRAAPQGAYFVWPVAATMDYARHLARQLGRADLVVISAQDGPRRLRGLDVPVVMDHAAWDHIDRRTAEDWDHALHMIEARRPRAPTEDT